MSASAHGRVLFRLRGSGPNGLAAAIEARRCGIDVGIVDAASPPSRRPVDQYVP